VTTVDPATPAGPGTAIREPAKRMLVASVARAMLEQARHTPCNGPGCERFRDIYERTIVDLGALLSEDLEDELSHLRTAFELPSPSRSKLRVAQAELVGWLEGLFSGIAVSVNAQRDSRDTFQFDMSAEPAEIDHRPMPGQYV
jgi:hypothetical protein